jgi:hypothetical protein
MRDEESQKPETVATKRIGRKLDCIKVKSSILRHRTVVRKLFQIMDQEKKQNFIIQAEPFFSEHGSGGTGLFGTRTLRSGELGM